MKRIIAIEGMLFISWLISIFVANLLIGSIFTSEIVKPAIAWYPILQIIRFFQWGFKQLR